MIKTDVIILWSVDYSESSRISTVLSRKHGKISLIAKGARKPKSKFSGMLQPGNLLSVIYSYKPSRSVQTLTEADYLLRLERISGEIPRMAISMSALELIGQLVHEGEVNRPVFDFTREFLVWLDTADSVSRTVFPYLQIRLARLIGLELQVEERLTEVETGYLNIEAGMVSAEPLEPEGIRLSHNQLRFLLNSSGSRKVTLLEQDFPEKELRMLIDYLDRYFRFHLDGLKPRRSDAIFDQILKDTK